MSKTAYTALRGGWRRQIDSGIRAKKQFQRDADECQRFFDGPYGFLYGDGDSSGQFLYSGAKRIPRPSIRVTINKVAEGVQLFGPSLYFRNPICKVNPREFPEIPANLLADPNDQYAQQMVQGMAQQINGLKQRDAIRSLLLGGWLNHLPTLINAKDSTRQAIDQAIITGAGCLWFGMDNPAGGKKTPMMEYDTVRNLIIDPDANNLADARWAARRFVKPVWEVEAKRGLPRDSIKGNYQSSESEIARDASGAKKTGESNDLVVYWGIWSKMGMGALLKGMPDLAAEADRFGQYVYLEVCDGYEGLLNCPEAIWDNEEEVRRRLQWETPFWCDVPSTEGWPFELLSFHKSPEKVWPVSHFKPGLGLLQFINWAYSFLISGIQKRSRDFLAVAKSAAEEIKQSLLEGEDMTLLEVQALNGTIDNVVKFLQHPEFKQDLFLVIEKVERAWEKSTGLSELMYGMQTTQDRSATETQVKKDMVNVRPDDMANTVEDFVTNAFRKLALMSRWHMTGNDIAGTFGPVIGQLWDQYVAAADVEEIINQIEYRIESGSTRKPNKAKEQSDAKDLLQQLFPVLTQYAQTNPAPANAVISLFCKANDIPPDPYLIPQPPPPPPPAPDKPKVTLSLNGDDVANLGLGPAIQADFGAQVTQPTPQPDQRMQDMLHKEASHGQSMRHADEKHRLTMKAMREKAQTNGSPK